MKLLFFGIDIVVDIAAVPVPNIYVDCKQFNLKGLKSVAWLESVTVDDDAS